MLWSGGSSSSSVTGKKMEKRRELLLNLRKGRRGTSNGPRSRPEGSGKNRRYLWVWGGFVGEEKGKAGDVAFEEGWTRKKGGGGRRKKEKAF